MSVLLFGGVFGGDSDPLLSGVTAFALVEAGGETRLAAASRNGLSLFRVGSDGSLVLTDQLQFSGAFLPGRPPGLAVIPHDEAAHLAVAGQMPGGISVVAISEDGTATAAAAPPGWPASLALVAAATVDGVASILTYDPFAGVLRLHGPDGTALAATSPDQIGTLRALTAVSVGDSAFAVAIEDGTTVTVLRLSADGPPVITARLGAADGIGLSSAAHIATAVVAGETFVIAGGSGSSSITVFRLGADGSLAFADHVIDTLSSRFQSVGALAVASAGGRSYVLAGGADDGFSVFVLLPGGRLFHLDAVADTLATTLQNVTALTAFPLGGTLAILAAGEGEAGITRLDLDISSTGGTFVAPDPGGSVSGTADDDILQGSDADDTLSGGDGEDILVDGAGSDRLIGGAGADVFIFDADGMPDTIADFSAAIDRIDLSRLPLFNDPSDAVITPTPTGATLRVRDETIILHSASGAPIDAEDLRAAILVDVSRPADVPVPDGPGATAGPDTIIGGDGDDWLEGLGGDDLIEGGGGNDVLVGGAIDAATVEALFARLDPPGDEAFLF